MSYTQRRYFAHAEQRRREGAGPSPDTPPPDMMLAHSFRASWGPGGTLVFGSRSVRMVQVAPDAAAGNGGDAESTRQRAKATLGVEREAKRFAAGGDPPPLAVLAREHKLATATAASSQAALQEAHAWKLVSALLDGAAHQAGGAAMGEAGEALAHVRQREAVCAWLRLAMWDTAAQELQEGGSAAARVWSLALDQIDQIELVGAVVPGAQGEETAPVEGGGGVASCIAACLEHRGNIWSCSLALPSEVQGVAVTAGHDATAKVWPMDGERLAALKQSTQQRRAPARLASLATLKVMLTPLSSPR